MKTTFKILHVLSALFVIAVTLAAIGMPETFGALSMILAFPLILANYETSDDAKQKRSAIWDEMQNMLELRKTEKRSFSNEEGRKYKQLQADFDSLSEHIKDLEADEKRASQMAGKFVNKQIDQNGKQAKPYHRGWVDAKSGEAVPVFQRGERITDTLLEPHKRNLSLGRLVQSYLNGDRRLAEAELREFDGLSTSSLSAGASVPISLFGSIVDRTRELSIIGRAAGVSTFLMDSETTTVAKLTEDPVFEIKAQNAAFGISPAPLEALTLQSFTVGAVVPLSRELAADSVGFSQALDNALAQALARKMDQLFLFGTGGGTEPEGIVNVTGVQEVEADAALTYSHIIDGWSKITTENGQPNSLFLNPRDLAGLVEGAKTDFGYTEGPSLLKDIAMLYSSALPITLGGSPGTDSVGIMGDFNSFVIGVRQKPMIEVSTHGDAFMKHQVAVKLTARFDCAVLHAKHFVKITGLEQWVAPVEGL